MNYSIFIKTIKYGFLVISIAIIVLIINNNISHKIETVPNQKISNNDFKTISQVLHKPTFMSIDNKKQPFKVMAKKATRYKSEPNIFNLDKPTGEIKSGEEMFFLSGDYGIFNKEVQQLKVEGNVKFKNENDMIFKTSEMYFDFKKEILSGEKKVKGKKNNSLIISEGFKILNKGEKIFFTGKTKLTLVQN